MALFLICLNVGILSLTIYTYQKNVEATETAVTAEQYYIAMSFERDFKDMTESNSYSSPSLLMQSFGTYYANKGLYLAFEENGETIYTNFKSDYTIEDNALLHTDFDGKRHIVISSEICDGKYVMIFAKNVESLDSEFQALMLTYAFTAIGVSLLLAVCLYFVLKKLSGPLEKLRKTTEVIEAGDFSVTAEEKGSDEFTLLAKSFNAMLAKINEQMAALENEAEKKQMLVDNMAHELRTPLTSIHGYAEYIEKANTTEERRHIAAKYIMSESERLQKISEILLDGAFIRVNEVELEDTDLGAVLSDIAEKLQMRAEHAQVEITCDTVPVTVKGNETLLSMLFYNLTENAIKACSAGGKVKISCSEGQAIIEDNGKGMTDEQLLHITEPFYRTDKSRSRAEGGAGLGLALCKQIVHTHRAEMRFESEIGKGTKIFITFTSWQ
ncbi:MAG: sensor histidine kinase [Eubacteriales bacterium]